MRPGFELGYEEDGKYYVRNHLQFNILVHPTHGEYMRARQGYKDAAVLENIDARRLLSRRQSLNTGLSEEQSSTTDSTGRILLEDAPAAAGAVIAAQDSKLPVSILLHVAVSSAARWKHA